MIHITSSAIGVLETPNNCPIVSIIFTGFLIVVYVTMRLLRRKNEN